MSLNLSKALIVLLACLAFVGQAMASTIMSYHMISMVSVESQEQTPNMSMMDHSQHNMVSDFSNQLGTSKESCCDDSCNCFTGGCSSLFFLSKDISNFLVIDLPTKIYSFSVPLQSQIPTSLYRPPILS